MASLSSAPLPLRGSVESLRSAGGRVTGSGFTNRAAIKYFNNFQQSIDEPCYLDLKAEDLSEPQAIQLKFHDWACYMIANPPMHQGKPVDPNTTIKNYFGLVKQRMLEDERFKDHIDLQGDCIWHTAYNHHKLLPGCVVGMLPQALVLPSAEDFHRSGTMLPPALS